MTQTTAGFLDDLALRPVKMPGASGFTPVGLALGPGASGLEVMVATYPSEPALPTLRSVWKERKGNRAAPLLLVVLYGDKAALCGATGDDAPAHLGLDPGQVERICREALEQPDRHAALRALRDSLPQLQTDLAGVRNEGFLATHELRVGARAREDWPEAKKKALRVLSMRGHDLLTGLGFKIDQHDRVLSILRAPDRKVAVAVLLNRDEAPELPTGRFSDLSPVAYALAVAVRENIPYVVLQHGAKIRVYPTKIGVGVGRRGPTETYLECHTGLLRDEDAGFLWLLCSAEALAENGTLEQLISESGRFAGDLAERLRERIYESVVPRLAEGIVVARKLTKPAAQDLADTYEMTMTVLFRLLFIAYAEDKDLLPYRWNGLYQRRSLKTKAQELLQLVQGGIDFDSSDSLWEEIKRLFRAVDQGNREWGVPAYNGGLFSADAAASRVGRLIEDLSLPNTVTGPVLRDLLLVESAEGLGPVDFRSLGVREFGTVYEGLLESELSVAETDLAVERSGAYRPVRGRETPIVAKGQVYLHNASGARKATGSYFTKHFAVEHLLERALDPALDAHLARIHKLDDDAAGAAFFDFRVADIAMGSGHFLVSAVDHIERAFTEYLSRRRIPAVAAELTSLRAAALNALGPLADQVEIEDTQLLRRLIARRCIYGVDINPVSVQLARLAIWIHTFVPGLPLSLLDHNLVSGNSLVGLGTLEEVREHIESKSQPLFPVDATRLLGDATAHLTKLAQIADATPKDIQQARAALAAAEKAVAPAKALFDIITACRIRQETLPIDIDEWDKIKGTLVSLAEHKRALAEIDVLQALHFPIAFPEVFLRSRAGFDVLVGNPPWEKARVEELEFWGRHAPGIRGLPTEKRNAAVAHLRKTRPDLVSLWEIERSRSEQVREAVRHFPGMNTGHPDLFRAFVFRFLQLVCRDDGRIAVVLPGEAFKIKGGQPIRDRIRITASEIWAQLLTNKAEWVFEDVDERKLIALTAIRTTDRSTAATYYIPPECHSRADWNATAHREAYTVQESWVAEYSPGLVLPTLPAVESGELVATLMRSPAIRSHPDLRVRRVYADFETTRDRSRWHDAQHKGDWPVYKGESFDLWQPDTGRYFAWTSGQKILKAAQDRRLRAPKGSAYAAMRVEWLADMATHPVLSPRIAFRDVTNRTNTRTLIVALIPPERVLTQTAPWILFRDPDLQLPLAPLLLGVLSSLICDWWVRRFVEGHVDEEAFNAIRVPRLSRAPTLIEKRVHSLSCRLAFVDARFETWAKPLRVPVTTLATDERDDMIHELDALVAHMFGLSERQLGHIFQTFHEGWDNSGPLRNTLEHYRRWKARK